LNANTGAGLTYQWNNNGSVLQGETANSYTANTAGSYTVTVTNSNGCSATSAATLVNVNSIVTPTFNQVAAICSGASLSPLLGTSINNINGSWTPPLDNTNTTTYTFTPTAGQCATSTAMTITVNPLPSATITAAGQTTFCQGGSVALNANTGAGLTYQWKNNGSALQGETASSYTANTAESYTVTVTNSNGCSATSAATSVTVNALPSVSAGNDQAICTGTSVTLTATGADTYAWNNNVTNANAFVPLATNLYTVTGTNLTTGCSNTDQVMVTVNNLPSVNAGIDQTVCVGTSVTLTATGADSYAWNNGVSNANAFVPLATNLYTVTGTNLTTGCSNTDQVIVTVNNLPNVNAGNDQAVCAGTSVTLTATGADSYAWNNNVTNANAFVPPAIGLYTVTGTNLTTGCSNTDQVMVTVNNLPSVNAGIDQAVCAGTSVTLTATGADTYAWNNGVSNANAFVPLATNLYTVTGTNLTTGCSNTDQVIVTVNNLPNVNAGNDQAVCAGTSVTLTATGADSYSWNNNVTNANAFVPAATGLYTVTGTNLTTGCTNTDQVIVTVNALPAVNAGNDQAVCAGTSVTLTATGVDSYVWNNNVTNSNAFVPLATNLYTVTGTNLTTGCSNTDQVMVTVNNLPSVNAGIDQAVCAGTSVTLTATGADTYAWNNGVSNANAFLPAATGLYTVTGTNLSTGCSNTDQVIVNVNSLPSINAGNDQTVCEGTSITLAASGADVYTWDQGVTDANAFVPQGTALYTVTGTNLSTGCSNTDQVIVNVNSLPSINAGNDQSVCEGTSITLTASGADTYQWNNGVIDGNSFLPTKSNSYVVVGTDANNCQDSDSVEVTVFPLTSSQLNQTALDSYTLNGQTYSQSGTYIQIIPNLYGCDSTITLNLTLSFTGLSKLENNRISIYPNPTSNMITINYDGQIQQLELVDAKGAKVYESIEDKKEVALPLHIQTGFYTVQIHTNEGIFRKALVIQR
jgi:hypothetical protein